MAAHYERAGRPVPETTRQLLEALGLTSRMRPDPPSPAPGEEAPKAAPRQGVHVAPILASLRAPLIHASAGDGPTLTLWFEGARLLTVNELLSILQYRKHQTFAYKKAWRNLVACALGALPPGQAVPFFDGPTRLRLFRRGRRKVDLDSLPAMFKYAIDGLRTVRAKKRDGGAVLSRGVIPDDHPEIIVSVEMLQEIGSPAVALRLERLPDWRAPDTEGLRERWLGS